MDVLEFIQTAVPKARKNIEAFCRFVASDFVKKSNDVGTSPLKTRNRNPLWQDKNTTIGGFCAKKHEKVRDYCRQIKKRRQPPNAKLLVAEPLNYDKRHVAERSQRDRRKSAYHAGRKYRCELLFYKQSF